MPSVGGTSMAAGVSSTPCATPVSDRFLATYKVGEPRPAIVEPAAEPVLAQGSASVGTAGAGGESS